jgi:tRNA pseudouridine55 synthase
MTRSAFGFLPIAKPLGPSSAEMVGWLGQFYPGRRGHSGTLDPCAEGVLIVAIGRATRLLQYIDDDTKEYFASIHLGITTDSDDSEGVIIATAEDGSPIERKKIMSAIRRVAGQKLQRPPSFSALKIEGKRAYELARKGRPSIISPRAVGVSAIELVGYEFPMVYVRLVCNRGFYVRSFARDLGVELGTGAYLKWLFRTRSGSFTIEQCINPLELASSVASGVDPASFLVRPEQALRRFPRARISEEQCQAISYGKAIPLTPEMPIALGRESGPIMLVAPYDEIIAIARLEDGYLHPDVVLLDPKK